MEIRLVASDWSGTISDDLQKVYRANAIVIHSYGKNFPSLDEFRKIISFSAIGMYRVFGIEDSEDILEAKYIDVFKNLDGEAQLIPDVKKTLKWLKRKNIEIGVLSSHPQAFLLEETKKYRIEKYFEFIKESASKEACLKKLLELKDLYPKEVMMVGDTDWDIIAGKAAGVITVGISSPYSHHLPERIFASHPDFIISSFSDLKYLIRAFNRR